MTQENKLVRRTQRSSRISTVVSLSLVIFLLGLLGVLLLHARLLSDYVKENIEISLILKAETDSALADDLVQLALKQDIVKSAKFISKEEAALILQQELGEDFVSFLGYNPLYPSVDLHLNSTYADNAGITRLLNTLKAHPTVNEVHYQPSLVESINRNLRIISWIILAFSILLTFIAVALINTTIRISLYANRLLIKSMLLVGATKSFIRKPFLLSSIWQGFFGALIAIAILALAAYFSQIHIPELKLVRDTKLMLIVACSMLFFGVILSFACTLIALNKYLRYRTAELY